MLAPNERKQIKQLLQHRFEINNLKHVVQDAGKDFDSIVRRNANKLDAIMDITENAEVNGWTPDLLNSLIADLESRLEPSIRDDAINMIQEVAESIKARWRRGTALDDPFRSCFVRGGWPFVNRPPVGSAFSRLAEPGGFRIAVVNGTSRSGKTYSKELVLFVADIQQNGQFKVYYYDIAEGDYAITAEQLVQKILLAWNLDIEIPARLSQSSSYATDLSEWLAAKVPRGETWWIIIDGLGKGKFDPGLLNFLMALARHLVDSPHAIRLVLLDLGEQNSYPPAAEQLTTRVMIDVLTRDDLVEHFFRVLHQTQGAQNPFDLPLISQKAQWVIDRQADLPL